MGGEAGGRGCGSGGGCGFRNRRSSLLARGLRGLGRVGPRGAARSGDRLRAGRLEAQVHVKVPWQFNLETAAHLVPVFTCAGQGACPNEQDFAAEQHRRSEWNKRYSSPAPCQWLAAGPTAGARWPWRRRQSGGAQQAEQKELTHGSQQRRVPPAPREEQHGRKKEPAEKQAEGPGYPTESEPAQRRERTVGSQN